ncbi:heparan-alpha-glucosaminide N-acetyltransferase [Marinomonas dokdonensis]
MSIGMMALRSFLIPWIPMQTPLAKTPRSLLLDAYRGSAVLLMIVFHFCWDLRNFGFIEYHLFDPFWVHFRSLILTLFFTAIGWSAYVSHMAPSKGLSRTKAFWHRDGKLLVCAIGISVATYLAAPQQWIYFGILHFIFLASILIRPFLNTPVVASFIGTGIIICYYYTPYLHFPNAFHTITQYIPLPSRTLDIVFPFPWIGVVLLGPLLGFVKLHQCTVPAHPIIRFMALLGRHALPIYLLHQLFLFALVAGAKTVLDWLI